MNITAWAIFLWAAVLEVGGDALIRKGLRSQGILLIFLGFLALGCYGLVVNIVRWDFSKLIGVYVVVFACISVLIGRFLFHDIVPSTTWIGLALIIAGGLIIQSGVR
jgi:drug/metabolite transporter superfamily protein YnfA